MRFYNESMLFISDMLRTELEERKRVAFEVLNPDLFQGEYAGKEIEIDGRLYLYRGYKAWMDLAELLYCRMLTPKIRDKHHVTLGFEKLNMEDSFHKTQSGSEKYGIDSDFFRIHKNEEPAFLLPYKRALQNVKIEERRRVLDLGVNSGDEFELIKKVLDEDTYRKVEFVGIDYSASAIEYAQNRFPEENVEFI